MAFTLAAACARRAPGPDECHDLATTWVLGARRSHTPGLRIGPAATQAILDRTTDCLTRPYDKELVQCVTTGSSPKLCMMGFEGRHPEAPPPTEP